MYGLQNLLWKSKDTWYRFMYWSSTHHLENEIFDILLPYWSHLLSVRLKSKCNSLLTAVASGKEFCKLFCYAEGCTVMVIELVCDLIQN